MNELNINGMSLLEYADYMREKHMNGKFEKPKKICIMYNGRKNGFKMRGTEPCSFDEAFHILIKGHELIRLIGR